MSLRGIKVLGLSFLVLVLSGIVSSCKGSHQLCPAYTKAISLESNQKV